MYKIAELYFHVGDFESTRRYLAVRGGTQGGISSQTLITYKLQYKQSFKLDGRQEDFILKVCNLMFDSNMETDINEVKYCTERVDKLIPKNIVFQLKEKILFVERPTNNTEDLENLIKAELSVSSSGFSTVSEAFQVLHEKE